LLLARQWLAVERDPPELPFAQAGRRLYVGVGSGCGENSGFHVSLRWMPSEKAILLPQRPKSILNNFQASPTHAVHRLDAAVHHVDEVLPFGTLLAQLNAP
jgi:hypothetical protein